jgi:rRNA maturation RNase YbeY
MITIYEESASWPSELSREDVLFWLKEVVQKEVFELGEISLVMCSDEHILQVNNAYLNHDYYTDIITFDYCSDNLVSGDLFVSLDTVASNAERFSVDFLEELRRVLVHGVLHLLGYKDKSNEDSIIMRQKEDYYLSLFVSRET